jgi:hypothetical protein
MGKMPPLTATQWNNFINALLAQFYSQNSQQRLGCLSRVRYFFEDFFCLECVLAAFSVHGNIAKNEYFHGIPKLDLGFDVSGNLCALELKHIPTISPDAKSRFIKGKDSTAVKDFLKLYASNLRTNICCKLLILYGPVNINHNPTCDKDKNLQSMCLNCAMDLFEKEIQNQNSNVQHIQWRHYNLTNNMYILEVDI